MTPRTILIDVIPPQMEKKQASRRLLELDALTKTYGGITVVSLIQKRSVPDYQTYVGSGKLAEILEIAREKKAELLIINNSLKPKQLFAVEEFFRKEKFPLKVWDRVDLILKIFQKHAKTAEAKLQIKLAAISHMGPRIFGMGMEMMQQAGGIGGRAGQGESNTEMMRRHLTDQERHIKKELAKASQSRSLHRSRRDRLGLKTISIVGYTNAGKSSLLNALTNKGALVANALFATLDTRVGKLWLPETRESVLLSDTIGFIQDLPPNLIQAFRSTLEETIESDLILHVIDLGDPYLSDKIDEVEAVLSDLGVANTPKIYVFNKLDTVKKPKRTALSKKYRGQTPVFVSSVTRIGLDDLRACIAERLRATVKA